ncbi:MAG: scpA, partial [Verrucomicrobiales bacterium]|nr:scpA [Verrucomicrobiales bacterium]
ELIRQLVEYKKFKDAAGQLQTREIMMESIYPRMPGRLEFPAPETTARPDVSIFDLINAVNNILKRVNKREDLRDIFEDKWTVSEKIEALVALVMEKPLLRFSELFATATSRTEVVVTFLAMLELVRLKRIVLTQAENFSDIEITSAPQGGTVIASPYTEQMDKQPETLEAGETKTETE